MGLAKAQTQLGAEVVILGGLVYAALKFARRNR